MAEAALSKSLDDLIKEQRQNKQKHTKVQKKQEKAKPAPRVVALASPSAAGKRPQTQRRPSGPTITPGNLSITVKGAVGKRPSAPRFVADPERVNPELRSARLEGDAKWGHEMYKAVHGERPRGPRAPSHLGTKLFVSNLDWKVTKDDIGELFETVGPLASHDVHYDASGRSVGTAEAVFRSRTDAERAHQQYNNVELDGQPMKIELIEKYVATASGSRQGGGQTLRSGIRLTGGGGPRVVTVNRAATQPMEGAAAQPRGRGNIRSRVVAMQE